MWDQRIQRIMLLETDGLLRRPLNKTAETRKEKQYSGSTLTWSPVTRRLPELLHSSSVMQTECVLERAVWSPDGCVSSSASPFSQPSASTGLVGCQHSTVGWWGRSMWQLSTCSPCMTTKVEVCTPWWAWCTWWCWRTRCSHDAVGAQAYIYYLPVAGRRPHCLHLCGCWRPQPKEGEPGAKSAERAHRCFQGPRCGGQNTPPCPPAPALYEWQASQ